jgi:hypothetical protein
MVGENVVLKGSKSVKLYHQYNTLTISSSNSSLISIDVLLVTISHQLFVIILGELAILFI